MAKTRKLRVFLSYAHTDTVQVRQLYKELIKRGFEVWFDEESLIPGQEWKVEIEKALDHSDVIVICISDRSVNKDGFIQKEFKFALDKALQMSEESIFLIPVRLNDCTVPTNIAKYHWVDLFNENSVERLVKALNIRLEQIIKRESSHQNIDSKDSLYASTLFPYQMWLFSYLPYLFGCTVYLILSFLVKPSTFSTTSLISILTILAVSIIQWLVLRPNFRKSSRWILFNILLSSYIFLAHSVILNLQSGIYRLTHNNDSNFEYVLFFKISFWVILIIWTLINLYMGYILHKGNKNFFNNETLGISFWNQWGGSYLIGVPISFLLLFSTQLFSLDLSNSTLVFSLIGLGMGFSQWLVLRKHFDASWWIFGNLIAGLVFGLALNTEIIMKGYFIDEILLFLWFISNSVGGPILVWGNFSNKYN